LGRVYVTAPIACVIAGAVISAVAGSRITLSSTVMARVVIAVRNASSN
jgi:hypothetical protein